LKYRRFSAVAEAVSVNDRFTARTENAANPQEAPMIRKAGIATLVVAFALATMPAEACTGISLTAKDGAVIRGRTLEFGFPLQSNVVVIPPGQAMSGTLPDGGKGISYTSKYGLSAPMPSAFRSFSTASTIRASASACSIFRAMPVTPR
jgi:hypothetical protein